MLSIDLKNWNKANSSFIHELFTEQVLWALLDAEDGAVNKTEKVCFLMELTSFHNGGLNHNLNLCLNPFG